MQVGDKKYAASSFLMFAVSSRSQIRNSIATARLLDVKMLPILVGHQVMAFMGFISMISSASFKTLELFPLFLKCFKMGFKPEDKVTTASTCMVLDVAIRLMQPDAAWPEHLVVGDISPNFSVRIWPAFGLTLQPSTAKAVGQSWKLSSISFVWKLSLVILVHLIVGMFEGISSGKSRLNCCMNSVCASTNDLFLK